MRRVGARRGRVDSPLRIGDQDASQAMTVVVPNRWQGEANCAVGPFSSKEVAHYFAGRVVDFGQYEVFSMRVFAKRDAWYVEVRRRWEQHGATWNTTQA